MTLRLVSADGNVTFELRPGLTLTLGRALSCDLPVLDPTISRKHAELTIDGDVIRVRDLGSSNGTFFQGRRTSEARLTAGDRIVFGKVGFELRQQTELLIDDATAETRRRAARAGTTIIRQVPVPDAEQALELAFRASGVQQAIDQGSPVVGQLQRDRQRLTLLVEISKALTRATDTQALLERMLQFSFRALDVEYATILLYNETGQLEPRISRWRDGATDHHPVSEAMAKTVVEQKVAVLSDSHDAHRATPSITEEPQRAVACAPLIASEGRVLGILYVDILRPSTQVSDEDLDFLVAFAGIGAVALDNIRFAEQSRREAHVRENFERFFTPHMAAWIASTSSALRLGGDRRPVAVLFADIRGFTPLAAQMAPDETARLLTEFFTEMVECVFEHGGTLDKFIGDAVMAQWGAPISAPDDADRALEAAVDMLRAVARLNATWRAQGRPEIQIGIGLNHGDVFAGYTGSERRLEYTVIGDTVNTASRLCAWAEGGEILVSDVMRSALTRDHALLPHPPLALRGMADPVVVFRTSA